MTIGGQEIHYFMSSFRIIPCLDIKDGRVVKGINFLNLQDAGDPVENALNYDAQGADELVFLDITASSDRRNIILNLVKKVSECLFIPFTVGGGVRTVDDMRLLLSEGADKVALNTAAIENPAVLEQGARRFGSQCIVCAIDARLEDGEYVVYSHGGRNSTGKNLSDWAKEAVDRGAGEILLTSMDKDGTRSGFDIQMLKLVTSSVSVPVIASGGAGSMADFLELQSVPVSAGLAASIFHYREIGIPELKTYLAANDAVVRPHVS